MRLASPAPLIRRYTESVYGSNSATKQVLHAIMTGVFAAFLFVGIATAVHHTFGHDTTVAQPASSVQDEPSGKPQVLLSHLRN